MIGVTSLSPAIFATTVLVPKTRPGCAHTDQWSERIMYLVKITIATLGAFISVVSPLIAHDFKVGDIEIDHPWSRPTPPAARVAGGYVTLTNTGAESDRLIEVTSPIANRVEIHRSVIENGVASMRPIDGIELEPGTNVDFETERLHFMFIEPDRPLRDGDRFPATLVFERAGGVDVQFMVQMRASAPATEAHSEHGGSQ